MKNKNITVLIVGLFVFFNLLSCKKYLDEKSDSSLVSPVTIDDAQALLDNASVMNAVATPSFGEASADDYFLLPDTYNSQETDYQHLYTWQLFDYYHPNDWSKCYFPVYNSNLALETINKILPTSENLGKWNNVKGSALFFRAYYFLELAWTFSKAYDETSSINDLGIALRMHSDFNIPSVRANVKETYLQIIQDAKESIPYLPEFPQHLYRPSKPAAYGLLARTYLSMRMYDSAFKYSNLCLTIKNSLLDYNPPNINANASTPFPQKFNHPEIIFYTEINKTLPFSLISPSVGKIDSALYLSYATGDIRKTAFFGSNNGYKKFKGNYTGSNSTFFSGLATDEFFLIRAECYARGVNGNAGDKDAALTDLNTLLINRWESATWTPITAVDANDALNIILSERRKELVMRGLRWMDIKRLNKEGLNITPVRLLPDGTTFTLPPNSNYYALPLPTDIILESGMPQNPH